MTNRPNSNKKLMLFAFTPSSIRNSCQPITMDLDRRVPVCQQRLNVLNNIVRTTYRFFQILNCFRKNNKRSTGQTFILWKPVKNENWAAHHTATGADKGSAMPLAPATLHCLQKLGKRRESDLFTLPNWSLSSSTF